jgi:hypothetical protein
MELTLTEALVVVAIKYDLPAYEFRALANWLECDSYIVPAERSLNPQLVYEKVGYACSDILNASQLFKIWLMCDLIESTLTFKQQEKVITWMNDSNY